ncbi:MAG: hypothetical protein ACKVQR_15110, partial [Aquabacterium sp.]
MPDTRRSGRGPALAAAAAAVLALSPLPAPAQAAGPVGPGVSPIVTFDPDRGMISRPPTRRPMTAAELKLAQQRAQGVWQAFQGAPAFTQPGTRSSYLTSWAVIDPIAGRQLEQHFIAYWSDPRDTRRHADGAFYGVMGGAHQLLWVEVNRLPNPQVAPDHKTRGDFSRTVRMPAGEVYVHAAPRQLGELAGGIVYPNTIVFTPDRRGLYAPAPLGPLLDAELARVRKRVAEQAQLSAQALQQLQASMTPEAVAQRRAKREAAWARETRDPAAMARRLDAAHRTDEADLQRQQERLAVPAVRDPKSTYWGPRLLLEVLEAQAATLDAAARQAPACGRVDPAFGTDGTLNVRFVPLAGAGADCVPMV